MTSALTLRYTMQMRLDIERMTREMSDLQAQVASGQRAQDLQGFAGKSNQVVNAQGLLALSEARASAATQLSARFGVQADALANAARAGVDLSTAIRSALSADDGRTLDIDLSVAFSSVVTSLNETWNGQPLFAGERVGVRPVPLGSIDDLVALPSGQWFDESERHQVVDLGAGAPVPLADKASEIGAGLLTAMRDLKVVIDAAGGRLSDDLTPTQRTQLEQIADALVAAANVVTASEGRTGQLARRIDDERDRLTTRANLLSRELAEETAADIPRISIELSTLEAQYQATAKIFSDLSELTLLNFLR